MKHPKASQLPVLIFLQENVYELLHFLFLHQTATFCFNSSSLNSCYISCFYIKPQLPMMSKLKYKVATFLVSTSNRNPLHGVERRFVGCYISCFYIKPQLRFCDDCIFKRCYISCFYIKPQLCLFLTFTYNVATFLVSTSNRNIAVAFLVTVPLLHFLFLHQTATAWRVQSKRSGCYISCFYIKPQQVVVALLHLCVATFLVSTSNRNIEVVRIVFELVATFLVSTSNRNRHPSRFQTKQVATFLVSTSNRNC